MGRIPRDSGVSATSTLPYPQCKDIWEGMKDGDNKGYNDSDS